MRMIIDGAGPALKKALPGVAIVLTILLAVASVLQYDEVYASRSCARLASISKYPVRYVAGILSFGDTCQIELSPGTWVNFSDISQ